MLQQRILCVEDHPLFADALTFNLSAALPAAQIVLAGNLADARAAVLSMADLDLITLDLCLPDAHGLEALIELRRLCPSCPILVISAYCDDITVRRGAQFGAAGFVSKGVAKAVLMAAVQLALDARPPFGQQSNSTAPPARRSEDRLQCLSQQQLRVLQFVCEGLLNKQIAHRMQLSEATIKCHVSEIMSKLGVSTRTQVVAEISRSGLCQLMAFDSGEPSTGTPRMARRAGDKAG